MQQEAENFKEEGYTKQMQSKVQALPSVLSAHPIPLPLSRYSALYLFQRLLVPLSPHIQFCIVVCIVYTNH